MKIFKLDKQHQVVCNWENTRNGFSHNAVLLKGNYEIGKTRINYLNRTWERFEYESILFRIIDCYFDGKQADKYREVIKNLDGWGN